MSSPWKPLPETVTYQTNVENAKSALESSIKSKEDAEAIVKELEKDLATKKSELENKQKIQAEDTDIKEIRAALSFPETLSSVKSVSIEQEINQKIEALKKKLSNYDVALKAQNLRVERLKEETIDAIKTTLQEKKIPAEKATKIATNTYQDLLEIITKILPQKKGGQAHVGKASDSLATLTQEIKDLEETIAAKKTIEAAKAKEEKEADEKRLPEITNAIDTSKKCLEELHQLDTLTETEKL